MSGCYAGTWRGLEQVATERTQGLEAANRQLRYLATHDVLVRSSVAVEKEFDVDDTLSRV